VINHQLLQLAEACLVSRLANEWQTPIVTDPGKGRVKVSSQQRSGLTTANVHGSNMADLKENR